MNNSSQSLFTLDIGIYQSIGILLLVWIIYNLPFAKIFNPYTTPLNQLKGPSFKHWYFGSLDRKTLKEIKVHHQLTQWRNQFGNIFYLIGLGRLPMVYIQDRKAVSYVFLTKSKTFIKPPSSNRILSAFFGEALLGVDGKQHARQRKVAFPAFTQTSINDLTPLFVKTGDSLVTRWNQIIDKNSESSSEGTSINCFSEFANAALDIIGKAGFGYDFNSLLDQDSELSRAFEKIFSLLVTGSLYSLMRSNSSFVHKIGHFFFKEQQELDKARKIVDKVSLQLVEKAKKEVEEEARLLGDGKIKKDSFGTSKDLLSLLVRSNLSNDVKDSEKISDHEIVSFVPTFLAAGHETTSTALSWCAYALTSTEKGLESQKRLRQELKSNPEWRESVKGIESLPYLSALTKEVLRLYAPVKFTTRQATENDSIPLDTPIELKTGSKVSSFKVQKGDLVALSIHGLNTEDETWGDGLTFRPERFLEDETHEFFEGGLTKKAREIKNGWSGLQTFTIGPRNCIGMRMAILEFQCIIASVVSNFELLPPKEKVQVDYRQAIVSRPVVVGQESAGFQLPIRIRKI